MNFHNKLIFYGEELLVPYPIPKLEDHLYRSPSIIRMIKSRRMKWTGHVARRGAKRNAYKILVGKPEGKRAL
jgi:hypothetical protein